MACRNRVERIRRLPTRSQHVPTQLEDPLIEKPSTERQKNPLAIQVLCECHLVSRSPGHPSASIVVGEGNVYLQPERLPSWPIPGSKICQTAGVDEISVPGHCCKSSRICMKGFTSAVYPSDIYSTWLDTTGKSQLWVGKYWIIIKLTKGMIFYCRAKRVVNCRNGGCYKGIGRFLGFRFAPIFPWLLRLWAHHRRSITEW
jgi:hypothetical protein